MKMPAIQTVLQGNILVVDDDPDCRLIMQEILRHEGHTCTCLASGAEARDAFDAGQFDLMITDLYLQDASCSGLELIDYVTRRDETIPVILVTGYPSIPRAVDAMRRGAVDFIAKPFDHDFLLHQVHKALQERRLRRENQRLLAEVNKAAVIEKLNRELDRRVDELTRLFAISEGLNQFMPTDGLFHRIAYLAGEVTGAQRVSVMVFDRSRQYLKIRSAIGLPHEIVEKTVQPVGRGVAGHVAATGKPLHVIDRMIDLCLRVEDAREVAYRSGSWIAVPLRIGQQVFGVINVTDKVDGSDFTESDRHIMESLAEKAGGKLENQALYEGIYSNLVDTLTSLVTTIEAKDPYTREHSQRVTDYAITLARAMGLSQDQVEMLNFAGMLHDIGKIGVRDGILTKAGRLSDEEYCQIKLHPEIGERIVEPLGLAPMEKAIIRHHHERFDGRGYPDRLAGDQIPLLARIVAVTDAFDAMTTTRSYRNALPVETAVEEMKRCAGSQFDPEIVRHWLELVEEGIICPAAAPAAAVPA